LALHGDDALSFQISRLSLTRWVGANVSNSTRSTGVDMREGFQNQIFVDCRSREDTRVRSFPNRKTHLPNLSAEPDAASSPVELALGGMALFTWMAEESERQEQERGAEGVVEEESDSQREDVPESVEPAERQAAREDEETRGGCSGNGVGAADHGRNV
jgi:hypothetical protein